MIDRRKPAAGLPRGDRVDVDCLASALDDVTASYKFLLLKTILYYTEGHDGKSHLPLSIDSISCHMLANSWFPTQRFRLHFGKKDQAEQLLEKIVSEGIIKAGSCNNIAQVREAFETNKDAIAKHSSKLTTYVFSALLKPWFKKNLEEMKKAGRNWQQRNNRIPELSNTDFDRRFPPLYCIDGKSRIIIHRHWCEYFQTNWEIINGWLDSHWMRFLTARNPHVSSLANKLWKFPDRRDPMQKQHAYWNDYIEDNELRCIYSGKEIAVGNYDLDHFLPWTWVAHNQLWNLIPVSERANRQKGKRLSEEDAIIDRMVRHHRRAIEFNRRKYSDKQWRKNVEDYVIALNAPPEDLLKPEIEIAYKTTFKSQLELAKLQGFKVLE